VQGVGCRGIEGLTKVRVRDDWAQLSAPHLQTLLQRCPHIKRVDISFGIGQEPWVETIGYVDPGFYNPGSVLHMKYAGSGTLSSAYLAFQLSKVGFRPNPSDSNNDGIYGVVVAKEPAKENLLQILEKHEWSHIWTRQCACVYISRLCVLGKVAFLSVVPGSRENLWMDFCNCTVLQWLRLNSSLTTLIVDLREDVDSFKSYLGFTPHVEPYVGSFPALQNLHHPLGHAPIGSIFTYSQILVNLPTLFPGLKSFRMDEWVEAF
jgi:hypothetical protein